MSPPTWTFLPLPPTHPSRLSQSTRLISLRHTANSCWLSILHMIVYVSMLLPIPSVFLFAVYISQYIYCYIYTYIYEITPLSYSKDSMPYILFCTFFHLKYVLEVTLHEFIGLFLILSTPVYGCAKLYSTSFSWMNIKLFPMFCYNNNATVIKNLFLCCFVLVQV